MISLLPDNATPTERALEMLARERLAGILPAADLMWDPARIPAAYLPWLAWAMSVDEWDPNWDETRKRAVISASVQWHRRKGTFGAIRAVLAAEGYGDARVIEDFEMPRIGDPDLMIGGSRDGGDSWVIGYDAPSWAVYWVELAQPISRRAADRLAARLTEIAPARCHLRSVTLTGVYFVIGDDLWLIGDDIAIGNVYSYGVN